MQDGDARSKTAVKVTTNGMVFNIFLTIFKFIAGFSGNSAAMIADAVHSFSDFITDIVLILGLRAAGKPADHNHHYGHGKIETLCAAFVGIVLFIIGLEILQSGLGKILFVAGGGNLEQPGAVAFIAAVVSILTKEALYRYTLSAGRSIKSDAMIANAWHHRSDAFSSVGTMIGIGGAMILGGRWVILDPVAAVIMSYFIFKVAFEISYTNINELTEAAPDIDIVKEISHIIVSTEGVRDFHKLKTRKIGSNIATDVHIQVDKDLSLIEAHDICTEVENRLRAKFGMDSILYIHCEPDM
ncbi:cation diffusion facilitator family transporter [Methanolobus mangrovi]|uniref:Cation diffusion facilitator family transporter n=1 Tax=Methanolobus mangrovi TaxID=3072977 RepID=A0AA51UEW4_9EURY|nr:cation diffusion facilitator family transporter [Methanolobus mangrovi]WMW21684.1 cation diffusion facilitator family transporter [Methanolobus mangrovi]